MNDTVFLVDVDNTLLDNDDVRVRLEDAIAEIIGPKRTERFWDIYEQVRSDLDHVDFPETLQRFGRECDDAVCLGGLSDLLYNFPFSACVYPGASTAIEHIKSIGRPVILSDGDQLFQRYKIRVAGLEAAVDGHVLVYVHKELETEDIRSRYPAAHYVMVDDKPRIHAALKNKLGDLITTVMVCQGQYAHDTSSQYTPEPDLVLDSIGDVASLTLEQVRAAAAPSTSGR